MQDYVICPNKFNNCRSFCTVSGCEFVDDCFLGFNGFRGGREVRFDFASCNLSCILCWADTHAGGRAIETKDLANRFVHCITRKDDYLSNLKNPVEKPESFNTSSIQIIGGETLLHKDRFIFLYKFLHRLNSLPNTHREYLKRDSHDRFKIKIFTNGISIGSGEISLADLDLLDSLDSLDIRLLLSIKGLNSKATDSLQKNPTKVNVLEAQVRALEILQERVFNAITIEPVLGFYHSRDFNIRAPGISANDMFVFNEKDNTSVRLRNVLSKYNKKKIYVEPVHAARKEEKDQFFNAHMQYLEMNNLIEPMLKNGSKVKLNTTKLCNLF